MAGSPIGELAAPAAAALSGARRAAGAIWHESAKALTHPSEAGEVAAAGRGEVEALAKLLSMGSDVDTPLRGDLGIARRVAWSRPLVLDEVKSLGHAFRGDGQRCPLDRRGRGPACAIWSGATAWWRSCG